MLTSAPFPRLLHFGSTDYTCNETFSSNNFCFLSFFGTYGRSMRERRRVHLSDVESPRGHDDDMISFGFCYRNPSSSVFSKACSKVAASGESSWGFRPLGVGCVQGLYPGWQGLAVRGMAARRQTITLPAYLYFEFCRTRI